MLQRNITDGGALDAREIVAVIHHGERIDSLRRVARRCRQQSPGARLRIFIDVKRPGRSLFPMDGLDLSKD